MSRRAGLFLIVAGLLAWCVLSAPVTLLVAFCMRSVEPAAPGIGDAPAETPHDAPHEAPDAAAVPARPPAYAHG